MTGVELNPVGTTNTAGLIEELNQSSRLGTASSLGSGQIPKAQDSLSVESLLSGPNLPAPSLSGVSIDSLLKAVAEEARRAGVQSAVEALGVQGDEIKAENAKKLEEIAKQIEEMKSQSFWDKLLGVFKIIGAVIGAIASVATTVVGAMTGNPLLIAAGAIGIAMTVDNIVSQATDGKVSLAAGFTKLGEACGMSEDAAKWFGFGMGLGITFATVCVSFGAAGASAVTSSSQTVASGLSAMSKVSSATNIASGVVGVGTGISNAGLTVAQYRIAQSEAAKVDIDAILEMLRANFESTQDLIEAELEATNNLMSKVKEIVSECSETSTAILTGAPTTA